MYQNIGGEYSSSSSSSSNLRLILVKRYRSTLHTVYNIQQYATRGSNNTTHTLSRRTAARTRFSLESKGCQKDAKLFANDPIRWAVS